MNTNVAARCNVNVCRLDDIKTAPESWLGGSLGSAPALFCPSLSQCYEFNPTLCGRAPRITGRARMERGFAARQGGV